MRIVQRITAGLASVGLTCSLVMAFVSPASATVGTYQTSTLTSALGTSSRSVSVPTGTTSGDVLVTQVVTNHNDLTGTSAPSGWTLGCNSSGGTGVVVGIWYRVAGSSEPASYTWTLPSNSGVVASMLRYSGIDNTTPFDTCSTQVSSSASTSMVAPAITTANGDEVVVAAYGMSGSGTTTPASGYTERTDGKNSTDSTQHRNVSAENGDEASGSCNASNCSIGSATATASMQTGEATPNWAAAQYALRPSVPVAPVLQPNGSPVVSGRTQNGSTLSTTNGAWNGVGISYSYQWQRCASGTCSNISGATSSSYTLTSSDLGKTIRSVVTATNGGGSTNANSGETRTIGYFYDDFSGSDGVITNEYAYWNPGAPGIHTSADWEMTSGCLFRSSNTGWTGSPDTNTGSSYIDCDPLNNSNNFRLNTKNSYSGNIATYVDIKQNTDIHDSNCSSGDTCWHGTHIWSRYQNEYNLYYASVNRADGKMVIKRKVPCGPDNSGTYFELTTETSHDWTASSWGHYELTTTDNVNGSVTLSLYDLDYSTSTPVVTGTDSGGTNPNWTSGCSVPGHYSSSTYTPLTGSGEVGIRGDFANFNIDNFQVLPN